MLEWRIPTYQEMTSLLWGAAPQNGLSGLCKDHAVLKQAYRRVFSNHDVVCWSSTFYEGRVRVVDFSDGFCGAAKANHSCFVRMVSTRRHSPAWQAGNASSERFRPLNNAVVDEKTGLVWSKDVLNTRPYTFQELVSLMAIRKVA